MQFSQLLKCISLIPLLLSTSIVFAQTGNNSGPTQEDIFPDPGSELEVVSHRNGDPERGTVSVRLEARNAVNVESIALTIANQFLGAVSAPPYIFTFDSTQFPDEVHTLFFDAIFTDGSVGSLEHELFFNNMVEEDITGTITSPADGSAVSGLITVSVDATDDEAVKQVLFYFDGNYAGYDDTAPYELELPTDKYSNGEHEIMARALDFGGITATSTITINIQNVAAPVPNNQPAAPSQPSTPGPIQLDVNQMFDLVNQLLNTLIVMGNSDDLNTELIGAITALTDVLTQAIEQENEKLRSNTRTKRVPRLMKRASKRITKATKRKKRRKRNLRSGIRKLKRIKRALR